MDEVECVRGRGVKRREGVERVVRQREGGMEGSESLLKKDRGGASSNVIHKESGASRRFQRALVNIARNE